MVFSMSDKGGHHCLGDHVLGGSQVLGFNAPVELSVP